MAITMPKKQIKDTAKLVYIRQWRIEEFTEYTSDSLINTSTVSSLLRVIFSSWLYHNIAVLTSIKSTGETVGHVKLNRLDELLSSSM